MVGGGVDEGKSNAFPLMSLSYLPCMTNEKTALDVGGKRVTEPVGMTELAEKRRSGERAVAREKTRDSRRLQGGSVQAIVHDSRRNHLKQFARPKEARRGRGVEFGIGAKGIYSAPKGEKWGNDREREGRRGQFSELEVGRPLGKI